MDTGLRILVLLAFASAVFLILFSGLRIKGADPAGKPPIARPAFILAKLALTVSFLFLLLRAIQGGAHLGPARAVVFLCLLIGGTVILILAVIGLGENLRMGLPKEETALITTGVYGFSRNPLYFGGFCLLAASVVYAFSWFNVVAAAIAVILHHRIVLSEERYLAGHFAEYAAYRRKVRRYI